VIVTQWYVQVFGGFPNEPHVLSVLQSDRDVTRGYVVAAFVHAAFKFNHGAIVGR
jgi:hypothetical protein